MKTRALIVDDSRLARNELKHLLKEKEEIKIVGEAANAADAYEKIRERKPDLLFLDIHMPGKSGFELLESLDEVPKVIFTTAYDEFAFKAFEYNTLDYLKKPITGERLDKAIHKLPEPSEWKPHTDIADSLTEDSRVFVKDGERYWFVFLRDVRILEIMDNYTRVHFANEKPMVPKTLNYLASRLAPETFFRANRQQIVNLKWVERIEPWFSGTIRLILKDGTEVEVSRRQTAKFKEMMSF